MIQMQLIRLIKLMVLYIFLANLNTLIVITNILLDFGKNQNHSASPLPNNRIISFNTTPRPIPKEHLKCNILKGNILMFSHRIE